MGQPREVLPVETPGAHEGPAVAVENQDAVEPVSVDLDEIPEIRKPDLMWSHGLQGPFCGVRAPWLLWWPGMGLFVEGHHLPDGGVAIAIA
jgi:hypothetical protein